MIGECIGSVTRRVGVRVMQVYRRGWVKRRVGVAVVRECQDEGFPLRKV